MIRRQSLSPVVITLKNFSESIKRSSVCHAYNGKNNIYAVLEDDASD